MSTMSQFFGGGIKSIQRGTKTGAGTLAISAVNLDKAVVISSCSSGVSEYDVNTQNAVSHAKTMSVRLFSNVQLTFQDGASLSFPTTTNSTVDWQVIEYV